MNCHRRIWPPLLSALAGLALAGTLPAALAALEHHASEGDGLIERHPLEENRHEERSRLVIGDFTFQ